MNRTDRVDRASPASAASAPVLAHAPLLEAMLADARLAGATLCEIGRGDSGVVAALGARARGLRYVGVGTAAAQRAPLASRVAAAAFVEHPLPADWLLADEIPGDVDLDPWLRARWAETARGMLFRLRAQPGADGAPVFPLPLDALAALLHALAGHRIRFSVDYDAGECIALALREDAALDAAALRDVADVLPSTVPVCRPRLPGARLLLPYLEVLDETRHYSNYGVLVQRLEAGLAALLAHGRDAVTTASSGTAALVGALLATAGRARRERPLCAMPAYTFVATAVAAEHCGYTPLLLDVSADDWQLQPDTVLAHPRAAEIGAVMPVAPYGRGVDQAPWIAFRERSGIAVVIDGAAGIEALQAQPARHLGPLPVALSLHATKALATGEGGAIVCDDVDVIARAVQRLNFGFRLTREARSAGSNGKMSEYHAAVGLAELDAWSDKQARYAAVAERYRHAGATVGIAARLRLAPLVASNYALLALDDAAQAAAVEAALGAARVEYRLWYGHGLQAQRYYAGCPSGPLPVTERLAPSLLGLPMSPDLADADVQRVVAAVADGLNAAR